MVLYSFYLIYFKNLEYKISYLLFFQCHTFVYPDSLYSNTGTHPYNCRGYYSHLFYSICFLYKFGCYCCVANLVCCCYLWNCPEGLSHTTACFMSVCSFFSLFFLWSYSLLLQKDIHLGFESKQAREKRPF